MVLPEEESKKEEETRIEESEAPRKNESEGEDDNAPIIDSSDEEESDEENAYQEDGFVVADDEDEDLPEVGDEKTSKNRLKRLRKGGKRKRLELDQEDLDLVAYNQGLAPSTKLRKTVEDAEDTNAPLSISVAKASSARTFHYIRHILIHLFYQ